MLAACAGSAPTVLPNACLPIPQYSAADLQAAAAELKSLDGTVLHTMFDDYVAMRATLKAYAT